MKDKILNIIKKQKPGKVDIIKEESPYAELLTYYLKEYNNLTEEDRNIIRNFFKIHNQIIKK